MRMGVLSPGHDACLSIRGGGPGGAVHDGEGDSHEVDPGGQGQPTVERVSNRSCTVVFLFSKTALEEPFAAAEGFHIGRDREAKR
jgi:hypothetical protein